MLEQIVAWDKQAVLALNALHTPFLDRFAWLLSETLVWVPLALVLLYVLFKNKKSETLFILLALGLLVAFTDVFSHEVVKHLVARPRPTRTLDLVSDLQLVNGYRGGAYGFWSNHAANMFGVALFLLLLFRHRLFGWSIMVWAALIGLSRVYLAVHFPTDVLCGALFGLLCGWGMYSLYRRTVARSVRDGLPDSEAGKYTASLFARKDVGQLTVVLYIVLACLAIAAYCLW